MRSIVRILTYVAWGTFLAAICLSYYYLRIESGAPRPDLGKVYVHNVHGQIVYIDFAERWLLNGLFLTAVVAFVVAFVIAQRKHPFR